MTETPIRPLAKIGVAARILAQSEKHTYDQVARQAFPPGVVVRLGRAIRFNLDRLEEWLAAGGTASHTREV